MRKQQKLEISFSFLRVIAILLISAELALGGYVDNGDGTVTDTTNSLMWQQTDDGITKNWQNALSYCEEFCLAGHTDWRLPNIRELHTIADDVHVLNPLFNYRGAGYWSSTSDKYGNSYAWEVNFYFGTVFYYSKTNSNYVRCVRGGSTAQITTNYTLGRDNYNFVNDNELVSVSIFNQTNNFLRELFSPNTPEAVINIVVNFIWSLMKTGGLCWGMSETSGLYYLYPGLMPINNKYLHDYTVEEAISAIEETQKAQTILTVSSVIWEQIIDRTNQKNDYELIKENLVNDKPVVISMKYGGGVHAVLAYKLVEYNNSADVYVYDPNHGDMESKINFVFLDQDTYVPVYSVNGLPISFLHAYVPEISALTAIPAIRQKISEILPELVATFFNNNMAIFRLNCPADAYLSDNLGRITGMYNGTLINEIPMSKISSYGDVEIYDLPVGPNYNVNISSYGDGAANINIMLPDISTGKIHNVSFNNIYIINGQKISLYFNNEQVGDLNVDVNGDNIIDYTKSASSVIHSETSFADADSDLILDIIDNCPFTTNFSQSDLNNNNIGDACECLGDSDNDKDIDGSDLYQYAVANQNLSLMEFTFSFGRIGCQ